MDFINSIKSLFGFFKSDSEITSETQDVSIHAGQNVSAHADHGAAHVAQDNPDNLIDSSWSGFGMK